VRDSINVYSTKIAGVFGRLQALFFSLLDAEYDSSCGWLQCIYIKICMLIVF